MGEHGQSNAYMHATLDGTGNGNFVTKLLTNEPATFQGTFVKDERVLMAHAPPQAMS